MGDEDGEDEDEEEEEEEEEVSKMVECHALMCLSVESEEGVAWSRGGEGRRARMWMKSMVGLMERALRIDDDRRGRGRGRASI